jgi:hypothetical protein
MSTEPPREDEFEEVEEGELIEEPGLEVRELDDEAFRTVDGAYSDEPADPAMAPVIEAGGGVAEGFEQAEAELVDHASEGPLDGTQRLFDDAGAPEEGPDRGVYGDADHESSSEDDSDE